MENVQQAKELYGLIHARFIQTAQGMALIREKYLNAVYGHCPRILCNKQILLPMGLSEQLKYTRIKVYCPKCQEIYKPRQKCSEIDGGYFGISYPQLFLMVNFILYRIILI
jgi:casein kinase II subunit beta